MGFVPIHTHPKLDSAREHISLQYLKCPQDVTNTFLKNIALNAALLGKKVFGAES